MKTPPPIACALLTCVYCHAAVSPAGPASLFRETGQELTSQRGNWSRAVALGDVDGNGTVDAVVAQGLQGTAQENVLWLNDGEGRFTESPAAMGSGDSRTVALADLDGDGDLDAWFGNEEADEIWLNQGGAQGGIPGAFALGSSVANQSTQQVVLRDLDGDGDLDAMVAGGNTRVWWNTSNGRFEAGPALPADWVNSVALADLDGDGDLDVVTGGEGFFIPNRVWWNQWRENQTFAPGPELAMAGLAAGVAVGHLDGDGFPDIYFAAYGPDQVWWNNGDRTFTAGPLLGDDQDAAVALADLDGDRDLDAFLVRRGVPGAPDGYWLNQGDRTFAAGTESLGGANGFGVALADLNRDGQPDVFVANSGPNAVYESLRRTAGRPGFFTDSGQLLRVRMTGVALGDLDGDGDLDAVTSGFGGDTLNHIPSDARLWLNQGGRQGGEAGVFRESDVRFDEWESKGVVLGDVDGDGDLDIFFANTGRNTVWLNRGGAQGGAAGEFVDSGQGLGRYYSEKAALADLDGDGDLDALVANSFARPRLWVNQGRAQGGQEGLFTEQILGEDSDVPDSTDLAVGDLDGDGDLDAVLNDGSTVLLYSNLGGLQGGQAGQWVGIQSTNRRVFFLRGLALGDLDGDRDLDLYLAAYFDDTIWVNEGGAQGGTPGFLRGTEQDLRGINSTKVALGDLDQDGDLDAFVVGDGDSEVWANDGRAGFSTTLTLGGGPGLGVALGDVDGDGDLDGFVASPRGGRIWLNGQTHWQPVLDYQLDLTAATDGTLLHTWWGRGNVVIPFRLSQSVDTPISVDVQARYNIDGNLRVSSYLPLAFPPGSTLASPTVWPEQPGGRAGEIWNLYQGIEEIRQDRVRYTVILSNLTAGVILTAPSTFYLEVRNPDFGERQCFLDGIEDLLSAAGGAKHAPAARRPPRGARPMASPGDTLSLTTYRSLRDQVLARSPQGRYFIDLYRRVSPGFLQTVSDHAWLLWRTIDVVRTWTPGFQALVGGRGGDWVITPEMLAAAQDYLELLRSVATPELRAAVEAEEEALNLRSWLGRTMTDALATVESRRIPAGSTGLDITSAPDRLVLRWWGEADLAYRLQQSIGRLDGFTPLGDWVEGKGAELTRDLAGPREIAAFYRLEVREAAAPGPQPAIGPELAAPP